MSSMQVLTIAQMRDAEQRLIDRGTSVDELMTIAGEGAGQWVWRVAAGRPVTVLCGPGNNGGDGYVIAEFLHKRGLQVQVVAPIDPKTDAAKNARANYQGSVLSSGKDANGEVLVDCLFGSGLSRALTAEMAVMLLDLAERHAYRIAIDVPSGIDSDSGQMLNERLPQYDLTLALGAWKFAHWRLPARGLVGEKRLVPIGIEPVPGAAQLIEQPTMSPPAVDAHKYRRGLCAIVGGEMPGAAMLASKTAMRAGAGYVKLLSDRADLGVVPASLVVGSGKLEDELADSRIDAILVGPGLGRTDTARSRLRAALQTGKPCLLDADALMLLEPDMLGRAGPLLATPHDGELEALCRNFSVIAPNRQAKAQSLAKASGMTIVAKGPDTIITSPQGALALGQPVSSWLSVAGTGDVLAGMAASRMATGAEPFVAACEAVWLHGEAARLCDAPFTADDLAAKTSQAMAMAKQA
ncbi:MAG: NAD(P)H-hydrate dehydratase [Erythrobacter sp.]